MAGVSRQVAITESRRATLTQQEKLKDWKFITREWRCSSFWAGKHGAACKMNHLTVLSSKIVAKSDE